MGSHYDAGENDSRWLAARDRGHSAGSLKKLPGAGCALAEERGLYKLNVGCPAVNMCLTWLDFAQTYFQGRKRDEALAVKGTAMERGCPASLFGGIAP